MVEIDTDIDMASEMGCALSSSPVLLLADKEQLSVLQTKNIPAMLGKVVR